jgi:2-hydroxychromene-2-carboxylate isomerase
MALNERLFRAYFPEGRNIGDPQVLRNVAHRARLAGADIAGEGQAGGTETFRPLDDLIID